MSESKQSASNKKKDSSKSDEKSKPQAKETTTFLDTNWSWSDFSSWPLSVKFLPVLIGLVAVFIGLYTQNYLKGDCASKFNYGFNMDKVQKHATTLSEHDWEIGTAAEGLLELLHPEYSVFGSDPFPNGQIPKDLVVMNKANVYVHRAVRLNEGPTLWTNASSVSDPAALGVATIMLGRQYNGWMEAAVRQKDYLLKDAPRYEENGAISHRMDSLELWSDAVFMVPPFLAYYAVAKGEMEVMKEAFYQIQMYRAKLLIKEGDRSGLWRHIVGESERADDGAWSTGNAWAVYGMLRVRATMLAWPESREAMKTEIKHLDVYIAEIMGAVVRTDDDKSGLLRNYLADQSWFGETSGTALLAAAAYRQGMSLAPGVRRDRILNWADEKRRVVVKSVDANGIAKPAVNPLKHGQREPINSGSPEGQSFVMLMGAAWRDCVCAGVCSSEGQSL